MSGAEMAFRLKRGAEANSRELIWQCRESYCFAPEPISPHAVLPDRLFDRDMLDLCLFYLPWSKPCSALLRAFFDPQMCLIEDQRTRETRRWRSFVENEVFARFVGDLFDDIIQDVKERSDHEDDDHD